MDATAGVCPKCAHKAFMPVKTMMELTLLNQERDLRLQIILQDIEKKSACSGSVKPRRSGKNAVISMPFVRQCRSQSYLLQKDGRGCFACAAKGGGTAAADPNGRAGGVVCDCELYKCPCAFKCHESDMQRLTAEYALQNSAPTRATAATADTRNTCFNIFFILTGWLQLFSV